MKKFTILLLVATFAMITSVTLTHAQTARTSGKTLRHVVMLKFKDTSSPADIKKVEDAFIALKGKISLIKDFEWGTNNSSEHLDQGLTHCFLATFSSEKDRNSYLVHPDHLAFVEILKPQLDKITVIDYWAKK